MKVPGRHRGNAGLASLCDLQISVEIHLPVFYAGVTGSYWHSHDHHTTDLHGMEPREGTEN